MPAFKLDCYTVELLLRIVEISEEKQFGVTLYDINNAKFEAETIINGPDK